MNLFSSLVNLSHHKEAARLPKAHGASIATANPGLGIEVGLRTDLPDYRTWGIQVFDVLHGSLAARSGLRKDDIIQSINGRRATKPADLVKALSYLFPGEKLNLTVTRNTPKPKTTTHITISNYEAKGYLGIKAGDRGVNIPNVKYGDTVYSGRAPHVREFKEASPAYKAGISEEDSIIAIKRVGDKKFTRINTAKELTDKLETFKANEKAVFLTLRMLSYSPKEVTVRLKHKPPTDLTPQQSVKI